MRRALGGFLFLTALAAAAIGGAIRAVLKSERDPSAPHYAFLFWGGLAFVLLLGGFLWLVRGMRGQDPPDVDP